MMEVLLITRGRAAALVARHSSETLRLGRISRYSKQRVTLWNSANL
jgi:hypothetical protein